MPPATDFSDFRRTVRGYDPTEVERALEQLQNRLDLYATERASTARQIKQLTEELADATERATRDRPSFSELGTAFEGTLRIAEEQSQKLFADATAEANRVLSAANARATHLAEEATLASDAMVLDARRRSEETMRAAEHDATKLKRAASKQLQKAELALADAESQAATVIAEAAHTVALAGATANQGIEATKRKAAELLFSAEQARVDTDSQIRRDLEEAERSRADTQRRAELYATTTIDDAAVRYEEIAAHAQALAAEYQTSIAEARQRDEAEMESTRAYSDRIVAQTIARSNVVAQDTEQLLVTMMADAENQVTDLRRQQRVLREYMGRIGSADVHERTNGNPVVYFMRPVQVEPSTREIGPAPTAP